MKIFKLFIIVSVLLMLVGIAASGLCENKDAEGLVRYGDRISRYKANWRKAIYAYQRALEIDPDNARAHLGLGRVFLQRDEYLRAAEEFEAALSIAQGQDIKVFEEESDALEFYITAARLMITDLNQPERARLFLEKAKEISPNDSRVEMLDEKARRLKESGTAEVVVEGFSLYLDVPDQKERALQIIRILEEARLLLRLRFDFAPREPIPLKVLTRLSFKDQERLFLAGSSLGIGSRDSIVIQTRGADLRADIFKEVLFHQFSRVWMSSYLGGATPAWLSEGFAVWAQKLGITGPVHVPGTAVASYRMVKYLTDQSLDQFRLFLGDLKTTGDLPLTLQNVYGISMEELQKQGKI